MNRAGKVTKRAKEVAPEPKDMKSVLRTHVVEGEDRLPQAIF